MQLKKLPEGPRMVCYGRTSINTPAVLADNNTVTPLIMSAVYSAEGMGAWHNGDMS